ncbi:MAG: PhzF family phenazine biosynthesis protein [Methylococcales bacterium]|nr:PhzF family phenazine biosynthesis protein [Methylococcales bacterium]
MNYNYYIADVFTRQIFNGAQIAVFPNADGMSNEHMRLLARELNLTATVFVFHPYSESTTRKMRIFSPLGEIDFAGHPIIATAYVLGSCGDIKLTEAITPVIFEQNVGPIDVNITANQGKPVFVQFSRKVSSIVDRFAPTDEELASFLSIQQSELDHKKYSPRLVSCGVPYLIVPVWSYETVRKAIFNYAAWSQSIAPQTAALEILLFAPKTPFVDSDFNARLLGPRIGIHEDPPIGSAMPAFASYLCSFEHTRKGTYTFAVDRGDAYSRRSVLNLEMDHKGQEQLALRVGGEAVMFAQGTIMLPD